MNKFLITYHGSGMPDDPALMEQAKAAFGAWVAEAGDAIVDPGAPVAMMAQVAGEGATDAVQIGGYSIIQADSVEDAKAVLSSHPYVARGGTLQVNQILDV
jgi:YCII-related domain-containing protein